MSQTDHEILENHTSESDHKTIESHTDGAHHLLIEAHSEGVPPEPPPPPPPGMKNGIWWETDRIDEFLEDPDPFLDDLEAGNVMMPFLLTGHWNEDYGIDYYLTDEQISDIIQAFHNRNSNFKVIAWVTGGQGGNPIPDLSDPDNVDAMIAAAIACCNKGFDGFDEDTEESGGSLQDWIDYQNAMATALRNVSKIATCSCHAFESYPVEDVYPQLDVDYIKAMLYGGTAWEEEEFKYCMDRVLDYTASPLLPGFPVEDSNYTVPFEDWLTWIDEQIEAGGPYAKLAGFGIYDGWLEGMQPEYWEMWDAWDTKD